MAVSVMMAGAKNGGPERSTRPSTPRPVPGVAPATVAYPGSPGAFAHIAGNTAFPEARGQSYSSVIAAIEAVKQRHADVAVLPCENVLAGRVPDIHLILPDIGLSIVGEVFQPIELHLLAPEGSKLGMIQQVKSHPVALRQVRRFLGHHGMTPVEAVNTATAAKSLAERGDRSMAVVASTLAAETYGLSVLAQDIADMPGNMTRFYVLAVEPNMPPAMASNVLTSVIFEVTNVPGALFRVMRGFADRGINFTKLESYLVDGQFVATRFLCEFEGHPEAPPARNALAELEGNTTSHTVLGVFAKHRVGRRTRADEPARVMPEGL